MLPRLFCNNTPYGQLPVFGKQSYLICRTNSAHPAYRLHYRAGYDLLNSGFVAGDSAVVFLHLRSSQHRTWKRQGKHKYNAFAQCWKVQCYNFQYIHHGFGCTTIKKTVVIAASGLLAEICIGFPLKV
jgi:hypothetical protein